MKKKVNRKIVKKVKKKTENRAKLAKYLVNEIESGKQIKWVSDMSLHEKVIDSQHQKLLKEVNELVKNKDSVDLKYIKSILDFLQKYALEHFSYEEGYMKKIGYPEKDFEVHKKVHKNFVNFYLDYKKDFDKVYSSKSKDYSQIRKLLGKAKKYLGEWLINHITIMDHKIYEYVLNNKNNKRVLMIKPSKIDVFKIKEKIKEGIQKGKFEHLRGELLKQREVFTDIPNLNKKKIHRDYLLTGILGFDSLFDYGIPRASSILVAGGAGSGKTIFCLQSLYNQAKKGKKCFYMTFEEKPERLFEHMKDFGMNPEPLIKKGLIKVQRFSPFDITRSVDALMAKEKGELLIDIDPVIIPGNFKPDFIVLDSLTAIASAFTGKEENYRIYIEQLFRFFEKLGSTSFLITETEQIPKIFSTTGVEEFLADGVIVLYNLQKGDTRQNAVEVLKLRGAGHKKKIVAFTITSEGIVVYPEQEIFGGIE